MRFQSTLRDSKTHGECTLATSILKMLKTHDGLVIEGLITTLREQCLNVVPIQEEYSVEVRAAYRVRSRDKSK